MLKRRTVARVLSVVLGIIFLISAIGKITDVGSFGELIIRYGFPVLSILAPVIVFMEMMLGVLLLLGLWQRISAILSGALLLIFTLSFFYANVFNGISDCGCFGSLGSKLPVWFTYCRNLLMIAMCVLIVFWTKSSSTVIIPIVAVCMIVIMVVTSFVIGRTYRVPSYYSHFLIGKHPLIDMQVKGSKMSDYVKTDFDSTYILYVFSYSCEACIDGINNAKQYNDRNVADKFYGLPVNTDKDSAIHKAFGIDFEEKYVGNGLQGMVRELPSLLYVKHDTIKYVIEGSVPSAYLFRKYYLD